MNKGSTSIYFFPLKALSSPEQGDRWRFTFKHPEVLILGAGLLASGLFSKKIAPHIQHAILGAVCGILFNIVGEFAFALAELLLLGSALSVAVISALISLPATLINGTVSIIIAVLLYIPLHKIIKMLKIV